MYHQQQLGITHVLDVEQDGKQPDHLSDDAYLVRREGLWSGNCQFAQSAMQGRPMCDFGGTDVTTVVNDCLDFIDNARASGGKVLVQVRPGLFRFRRAVCGLQN